MDKIYVVHFDYVWFNNSFMSGEQVTNNSINNQNYEGNAGSNKNSKKKVDINNLLNRVRANQKKEKLESTIFFTLVATVIVITGIIISI